MIHCCAKRPDYYEHAYLYLRTMKNAGFRPTRDTFISLLYAAAMNGDLKVGGEQQSGLLIYER